MLETANLAKKPHTKRDNRRKKTHTQKYLKTMSCKLLVRPVFSFSFCLLEPLQNLRRYRQYHNQCATDST